MSDTNEGSQPGGGSRLSGRDAPARSAPIAGPAEDALGEVKTDLKDVRHEVERVAGKAKAEAESQIDRVKDDTLSFAEKQKDLASQQLIGVATALKRVSEELSSEQPTVARYTRSIAGSVERVSRRVENHDVDSLVGMAEDFGRRQPASLLTIAALAGFVSGRFLLASGRRRESRTGESATSSRSNPSVKPLASPQSPRRETDG